MNWNLLWAIVAPHIQMREDESRWLCDRVDELRPRRILEIGRWAGGTTALFAALPTVDTVVSIDIAAHPTEVYRLPEYMAYIHAHKQVPANIVLVQASSQNPFIAAQTRAGGTFDFVFIDGAHEEDLVQADWDNYHTCAPVVGFHDIRGWEDPALIPPNFGPPKLWAKLRTQYKTQEAVYGIAGGMGLVYRED